MGLLGPPESLPRLVCLRAPFLYIIYTADLGQLLASHAMLCQSYAGDAQAYLHYLAPDAVAAVQDMSHAMDTQVAWMLSIA